MNPKIQTGANCANGENFSVSSVTSCSKITLREAKNNGWTVISMKDCWKTIFPPP